MKGIIYEPTGNAREYADLALNMYKGCYHGCIYCYAPNATFQKRDSFNNQAAPKKDILERLKKQLKSLSKKKFEKLSVLMSFTCDPYQPIEEKFLLTREAIKLLNENGFPVTILTKGGILARRDFDLLKLNSENKFGVTLTLLDVNQAKKWEPYASLPVTRFENLVLAKEEGVKTWVSLEPIIDVEQALKIIDTTHLYTDFYGIGKLNYHKHQKTINWKDALKRIRIKLDKYKKERVIHNSLRNA